MGPGLLVCLIFQGFEIYLTGKKTIGPEYSISSQVQNPSSIHPHYSRYGDMCYNGFSHGARGSEMNQVGRYPSLVVGAACQYLWELIRALGQLETQRTEKPTGGERRVP